MGDGWQLCATELCHVYADAHNRAEFLSLTLTFQARSLVAGWGDSPGHCRTLSSIPGLFPRDANTQPLPGPSCSNQNVSRHCQCPSGRAGGPKSPRVRTPTLDYPGFHNSTSDFQIETLIGPAWGLVCNLVQLTKA